MKNLIKNMKMKSCHRLISFYKKATGCVSLFLLIVTLNVSAQQGLNTFGGIYPNCSDPAGFILGQGAVMTAYQNPLTGCGTGDNDCGIRTPGASGTNPAFILFPAETLSTAGSNKCFSMFAFDANLSCSSNKGFPCAISVTGYIVPAAYTSNNTPAPGQYLGKSVISSVSAYGSENCLSIPFSVPAPDLTQQYRVLLDFSAPQNCNQPGTKYVIDFFPAAPVFAVNPDFNTSFRNVSVTGNVSTNDKVPAGTLYSTTLTTVSAPTGSSPAITMNSNGSYSFSSATAGLYVYDVPVCFPNQTTPCAPVKLAISVVNATNNTNNPIANADLASTLVNTSVIVRSLANDAHSNTGNMLVPATVSVVSQPAHGIAYVNSLNGNVTYIPNPGFIGTDTLTYRVYDNQAPAVCATAVQIITVKALGAANTTSASDDFKISFINVPATGNVLINDTDPEGNLQTTTAQNLTVPGKGTLVLTATGNYIFTPINGFTGTVSFPYTVCDNGTLQACAVATLCISVRLMPDFTPSNDIDALSFLTGGSARDMVVNISEINNDESKGPVVFRLRKISAFTISYNTTAAAANVFGGTPVRNIDWLFTENLNFITCTLKPGVTIAGYGVSPIGFTITRNQSIPVNTNQSILAVIQTGSGGDSNPVNNFSSTSIIAN